MTERQRLEALTQALQQSENHRERIDVLNRDLRVQIGLQQPSWLKTFCTALSEECELVIKSLIAIGQDQSLFVTEDAEKLRILIEDLLPIENFYKEIGGIVGYHSMLLSFLEEQQNSTPTHQTRYYHRPQGIDIAEDNPDVRRFILQGIFSLPLLGEIYPVGGAADRLNFSDPSSGQPLPAARLGFCGQSLLEGLIRDVQAREYLYYKLFGEHLITPIAMMTSLEKDNHRQIVSLCEEKHWFGRPKESFRFFCQPLVPTIDKQGNWCWKGTLKLLMKPGGHGVIWKVAKDEGIFAWFENLGRKKALVRQINNPIAGVDYGLLAFCGVGFAQDRAFGFASCPRQVQSAEGVNVLIETQSLAFSKFCLTNIEYCDFQKFAIQDIPENAESSYSLFPSNTNILLADIEAVQRAIVNCPIPGMLVNLRKISFVHEDGRVIEQEVARLESTMQNIADCFTQMMSIQAARDQLNLDTYLTYNHRHKTISTTKKLLQPKSSLLETPEGCLYDLLRAAHELLQACQVNMPPLQDPTAYIEHGPAFLFSYHPALGPLFSIIAQKIRGGKWAPHSELVLEIAEVQILDLNLSGSLRIHAEQIMGKMDLDGVLHYSEAVGCLRLVNVTVANAGYDTQSSCFWKGDIYHHECCSIQIHGDGEFIAENVTLQGDIKIEVQSGMRVTAYEAEGKLQFRIEPRPILNQNWTYHLSEEESHHFRIRSSKLLSLLLLWINLMEPQQMLVRMPVQKLVQKPEVVC